MYENRSGSRNCPMSANTVYIRTRMKAPAIGLITLYTMNSQGSVQFESISQPSHAAHLNDRQCFRAMSLTDAVTSASLRGGRASRGMRAFGGPGTGRGPRGR